MTHERCRALSAPSCTAAIAALAAVLALATPTVLAGTFSVSPVRIYMQSRERATAVTIVNEGTTELVMQADVFAWSQGEEGKEQLTPTEDIVLAPPILKLAPGSRQVVRLANLRPPPVDEQQTYRLIVREVPEATAPPSGINVQVALAFSLPVFITPSSAKALLICDATRGSANQAVVTCENGGKAYAQPVAIALASNKGETIATQEIRGGYLLPRTRRTFELSNATQPLQPGGMKLIVTLDDGSKQTFDVQFAQ